MTLYETLATIVSELPTGTDRGKTLRPVFEAAKEHNRILANAIAGDTTCEMEFRPLVERARTMDPNRPYAEYPIGAELKRLVPTGLYTFVPRGIGYWEYAEQAYEPAGLGRAAVSVTLGGVIIFLFGWFALATIAHYIPPVLQLIEYVPARYWVLAGVCAYVYGIFVSRMLLREAWVAKRRDLSEAAYENAKWIDRLIQEAYAKN